MGLSLKRMYLWLLASRRAHRRFRAQEVALISFRSSTARSEFGQILNMSMGGLAFRYLGREELTHGMKALDIFYYRADEVFLNSIPCEVIYDTPVERTTLLPIPQMRRCGVRFGELSEEEQARLAAFIQEFTY